jgi:AcrR family transcriptional regulator
MPFPSTTKDRILAAAMEITSLRGARHLTIDAVTVESGLSKGGVLYHFPSKTALLEGVVALVLSQMRARMDIHLAAMADQPNRTLASMVRVFRDVLEGTVSLPVALVAASAENPALLDPVRAEYDQLWQAVKSETDDRAQAFVIWSALEGLYHFDVFDLAPEGRSQLIGCLVRLESMVSELPCKGGQNAV